MIGEEASDHLLEPSPLLGDRLVHAPSQCLLDPPERCLHAIASCCSFDKELPTAVAFTDEGKAKKVEGLRFSEPAMSASFRRHAAADRKKRGVGRPETFAFLGFTFICGKSRRRVFQLQRKTRRDRMRAKLQEIKAELRQRMHQTIPDQGHWLRQVVTGHFAYYAVPTNSRALSAFRHYVADLWRRTLRRRSQKDGFTWDRMTKLVDGWLPAPRILHPWPDQRFAVKHPR